MPTKTCPNCHANVSSDLNFCPECGTRLPEVADAPGVADATQAMPGPTQAMPATQVEDTSQGTVVPPTPSVNGTIRSVDEDGVSNFAIGAISALVVLLVAAVVIFVTPLGDSILGRDSTSDDSTASEDSGMSVTYDEQEDGSADDQTRDEVEDTDDLSEQVQENEAAQDDEDEVDEDSIRSDLTSYYQTAGSYDSQISNAASTFNASWGDSSVSTRRACYNDASNLLTDVTRTRNNIRRMDVPSDSVNYEAWTELCACYDDLVSRIDVICSAWEVSVSSSDPSQNQDQILAPLRAAQDSTGSNAAYNDFVERYAGISIK